MTALINPGTQNATGCYCFIKNIDDVLSPKMPGVCYYVEAINYMYSRAPLYCGLL